MDAVVKRGNAGYGYGYGYGGYGNSKPQMNYHRQNSEYVTTVVTEMNRMTVNEKPSCGGAIAGAGDVHKQVYKEKEEVFVEQDKGSSYGSYHSGGSALQMQSYEEEVCEETTAVKKNAGYKQEKYGEADGGYGAHHYGGAGGGGVKTKQGYSNYKQGACGEADAGHGGGAVQTYAYDQQATAYGGAMTGAVQQHGYQKEAYGGGAVKKDSYKHESYGEYDAGYGSHYGGGAAGVQTSAYKKQEKYGEAAGGYGGSAAGVKKQGGYKQVGCGIAGAGHGAHYGGGGGAVQAYGYDQQAAYGGHHYGGAGGVKKQGYKKEAYGQTDAGYGGAHYGGGGAAYHKDSYGGGAKKNSYAGECGAGYGSHYGGGYDAAETNASYAGAVQKYGCGSGGASGGYGLHHGGAYGGYNHTACESESESDSDESDCEEAAFPPRGPIKQGGVHGYGAGNHGGGVRRYESYETRQELGGGRRYELYQSTTEYTGGRGGYGTCYGA